MSTPDDRRDELLATALEQCLEGSIPTAPTIVHPDPDLDRLRSVADLLRRLSTYLRSDPVSGQFWTSPPGRAEPAVPPQVGKYRVLRVLGAGGQAQTLLAVDPDLNRQVVLKLYHDRRPEVLDAVLREGQALARVRSPRVAQCYGVERHDGLPFLVMEFVPGRSLTEVLKEGPLAVPVAVELGAQLAEGLAAVHACGLLHRDLKPANVLIGRDGAPRLVDFGLSVFHGAAPPGEVAGTLQYMAPEQAGGEADRIDPRTDVWGLGAVLYAALTGRAPYEGRDALELLEKARLGRFRPPQELRSDLPEAVNRVTLRCLAAEAARRYASASEAAEALRQCLHRKKRPAVRWWLGAAAAAVLLGGLAAWIDARLGQAHRPAPAPSAGWHPDGRLLRRDFALNVRVHGGKPRSDGVLVLRDGKQLILTLESSRDCYAAILHVSPDGETECLLPNARETDMHLQAGRPRNFPAPQDATKPYRLDLKASAGTEFLHVIASTHPWQPPQAVTTRGGLFAVFRDGGEESLRESIRGLEWPDKAAAKDRPLVTEQVVPFVVEPARE
jgi:hypothetical protein